MLNFVGDLVIAISIYFGLTYIGDAIFDKNMVDEDEADARSEQN